MTTHTLNYVPDSALVKRLKSFAWRGSMMTLAFALGWAAEHIGLLELDPTVTMILGLVLGEVSKALNTGTK
jgi:hypothetical protein